MSDSWQSIGAVVERVVAKAVRPIRDNNFGGVKPGDVFEHLTAISVERKRGSEGHFRWFWLCSCICGKRILVTVGNLQTGNSKSCGCMKAARIATARTVHGHNPSHTGKPTKEYNSWGSMIARCTCPTNKKFPIYGGRGIAVCERWRDSFLNFLADMGPRPAGTTIDRIDVNGNYEPGNCRWATPKVQANNKRCHVKVNA